MAVKLAPGDVIAGRYRIERVIGSGGMGVVLGAHHLSLDVPVAMKVMREDLVEREDLVRRFLREGHTAARIKSEHVARIFDADRLADGRPFLVLELLEGADLSRVLRERGPIPFAEAIDWVMQACEGVAAAHALGLVHRDLKLANLFVTRRLDGSAWIKVLDFGVVRSPTVDSLDHAVVGSPKYMAPEQRATPNDVDARADVYALGVVLYRLLTNSYPPDRSGVDDAIPYPDGISVPETIRRAIARALAPNREDRPPTVGAFAAALGARRDTALSADDSGQMPMHMHVATPSFHPTMTGAQKRRRAFGPASAFFGRDRDLARIDEHFRDGEHIVTLVGPAGVGKTRLSLRYLEVHEDSFAFPEGAGAWVCDLSGARTTGDVLQAIARDLDLPLGADRPLDSMAVALSTRGRMLVVLDNCEQVVDDVCAVVQRLATADPEGCFLLTSREIVRVPGECVMEIEPLSLPTGDDYDSSDSVRLFLDRARRAGGVVGQDGEAIAEIVRRLDGLPLAIELAAARTRVLAPPELLKRLGDRFALLDVGARGAPSRQRTLRDAIDWSWSLLDATEQETLAQCAVFRGGFSPSAAETVVRVPLETHASTLDVLQSLRDKSLLRAHDGAGEARLGTYESIRAYAAEQLAPAARKEAERRHARHYVAYARALLEDSPVRRDVPRRRKRLLLELENLAAIPDRLLASEIDAEATHLSIEALLAIEGAMGRGRIDARFLESLERALTAAETHPPEPTLHARALIARGRAHQVHGKWNECRADLERALTFARVASARTLEGGALTLLANLPALAGNVSEARAGYERAIEVLDSAGDDAGGGEWKPLALGNLGTILRAQGELEGARRAFEDGLLAARDASNRRLEGHQLTRIAQLLHAEGNVEEARPHYEQAIAILREADDPRFLAAALSGLGLVLEELELHEEAQARCLTAIHVLREIGDQRSLAAAVGTVGMLLHEAGVHEDARTKYREAVDALEGLGERWYCGIYLAAWGALEAACDDRREAERLFERSEKHLHAVGDAALLEALELHRGQLDLAQSRAHASDGDARGASRARREAEARLPRANALHEHVRFARRLLERALKPTAPRAPEVDAPTIAAVETSPSALVIETEGRWFRAPRGSVVDLTRRKSARLLLLELVATRTAFPGTAASVSSLVAAGWPGEKMIERAGVARLYVALSALRNLGLRDLLLSRRDGYLLDPGVEVVRWPLPRHAR